MNTTDISLICDNNEENVNGKSSTSITCCDNEDFKGEIRMDECGMSGAISPDIVPDDNQINTADKDEEIEEKIHDDEEFNQIVHEQELNCSVADECQLGVENEELKQAPDEQHSSGDKMELDLPDVVPERSETSAKAEGNNDTEQFINKCDDTTSLGNVGDKISEMSSLRSVLKKNSSVKKNLHVSFCDTPVLFNEPEQLPNLTMFWESEFRKCWNDCDDVAFDVKVNAENGFANNANKSQENAEIEEENDTEVNLTTANVLRHDRLTPFDGNVDSDSETNSSQDTVILMTSEESKRNRELIQQSQRRFEQQKPIGCKDSVDFTGTNSVLRSNSAVRKCLERTALRRSLTQCSNTRRKTLDNNSKQSGQISIMEKLRQLTKDAKEDGEGDDEEDHDEEEEEQSQDIAQSLPRLDLKQVENLMSERCPINQMYLNKQENNINVPGDVRQWKLQSKLWEHDETRCPQTGSMDSLEENENYDVQEMSGDELEQFVQQDWERIERVRQKYTLDGTSDFLELCNSRRPPVRGIRPRFGSTTQIMNQMQQQLQPPPLLTYQTHRSWPNTNHSAVEAKFTRYPVKYQQQHQQQTLTYPLLINNNHRLSCPSLNERVSTQMKTNRYSTNELLSKNNTRFVSDV